VSIAITSCGNERKEQEEIEINICCWLSTLYLVNEQEEKITCAQIELKCFSR
jgi:hypothetical protein